MIVECLAGTASEGLSEIPKMDVEGANMVPFLLSLLSMDAAEELFNYVELRRTVHFGVPTHANIAPAIAPNSAQNNGSNMSTASTEPPKVSKLATEESIEDMNTQ